MSRCHQLMANRKNKLKRFNGGGDYDGCYHKVKKEAISLTNEGEVTFLKQMKQIADSFELSLWQVMVIIGGTVYPY